MYEALRALYAKSSEPTQGEQRWVLFLRVQHLIYGENRCMPLHFQIIRQDFKEIQKLNPMKMYIGDPLTGATHPWSIPFIKIYFEKKEEAKAAEVIILSRQAKLKNGSNKRGQAKESWTVVSPSGAAVAGPNGETPWVIHPTTPFFNIGGHPLPLSVLAIDRNPLPPETSDTMPHRCSGGEARQPLRMTSDGYPPITSPAATGPACRGLGEKPMPLPIIDSDRLAHGYVRPTGQCWPISASTLADIGQGWPIPADGNLPPEESTQQRALTLFEWPTFDGRRTFPCRVMATSPGGLDRINTPRVTGSPLARHPGTPLCGDLSPWSIPSVGYIVYFIALTRTTARGLRGWEVSAKPECMLQASLGGAPTSDKGERQARHHYSAYCGNAHTT